MISVSEKPHRTRRAIWLNKLGSTSSLYILGGIVFALLLVQQVPASWGAKVLTSGTGLGLSGLSGSAFKGRAAVASLNIHGREYPLGALTWDINVWSLITLNPCIHLTTALTGQSFVGDVCAGLGNRMQLKNADLALPLSVVKERLPLQVDGNLSASIVSLDMVKGRVTNVDASLRWGNARAFNGAAWVDIGAYGATVTRGDERILAKIVSLDGPVDANLAVEFADAGGGNVNGNLIMTQDFINTTRSAGLLAMFSVAKPAENNRIDFQVDTSF